MNSNADIAKIFKALCDENRVEIIKLLQSGEKCACAIYDALDITKPTISHHMKILVESGIVSARKQGKWTHYSINSQGAKSAQQILNKLLEQNINNSSEENCVCK